MKQMLCILNFLLFAGIAFAQDEVFTVGFTTLGWEHISEKLYFKSKGQAYKEISIETRARSQSYQYTGPSPMVFYMRSAGASGEALYRPVASIEITTDVSELLLLFVPTSEKSRFRVFVMNDSQNDFPRGSVRFFNMTERNLGVLFDGEKIPLTPHDFKTSKSKIEKKRVNMAIFIIRDEQLRDIYNAQWGQDAQSRYIIFIKDSDRRIGGVETRSIPQFFSEN